MKTITNLQGVAQMMPAIIETPTGRFTFVGCVPLELAFERKDGKPMGKEDAHTLQHCMAPALFGYKTRCFETKEDALAAWEAL